MREFLSSRFSFFPKFPRSQSRVTMPTDVLSAWSITYLFPLSPHSQLPPPSRPPPAILPPPIPMPRDSCPCRGVVLHWASGHRVEHPELEVVGRVCIWLPLHHSQNAVKFLGQSSIDICRDWDVCWIVLDHVEVIDEFALR